MTALGLRSAGRLALSPRRRRRSTVPPESPDQISSLAFWYDAEASPTIEASGVIERWDDLSGNGNHGGQAVSSERRALGRDLHGVATGVDHEAFFSLQNASAASGKFQWLGRSAESDPLVIERDDNATVGLALLSAAAGNALFHDLDGQGSDTYDGAFATSDQIILAGHYNDGTFGYSAIDVYELGLYTRALGAGERTALYDYLRNKYGL